MFEVPAELVTNALLDRLHRDSFVLFEGLLKLWVTPGIEDLCEFHFL